MTLRMVLQPAKSGQVFELHGWLSGPEVEEFERVAGDVPLPFQIDLFHLAGADASGVTALKTQRERGVRLVNASPYLELLLTVPDPQPGNRVAPKARRGSARDR
jgi:hypothetical protein